MTRPLRRRWEVWVIAGLFVLCIAAAALSCRRARRAIAKDIEDRLIDRAAEKAEDVFGPKGAN